MEHWLYLLAGVVVLFFLFRYYKKDSVRVAGVGCFFAATALKRKIGYDDSLDVFGVHGVGGIIGALLTGVFAAEALGGAGFGDGISGIGGAFAVIPNPAIRAQFEAASAGINPGLTALPIVAMQAAYGECQTWLDETVSYLQANRDFLYENLWEIPGIDLVNPEGTYFLWIDFSKTGFNDPYTVLCEAGVELSNGDAFGDSSYLRLNFASPRARLEKALSRLQTLFG